MKNFTETSRKTSAYSMKEAINSFLEVYKMHSKINEAHIIDSWSKMMGDTIAQKTTQIYLKGETLHVRISSASLRSELQMSKTKIIEVMNRLLEQEILKEIVFL